MYARILCPIDGSSTSNRGMKEAIGMAREHKAELLLLYVADAHMAVLDPYGALDVGSVLESLRQYGIKLLEESKAAAEREGVSAKVEIDESLSGRVAEIIVQKAAQWPADLIVMGTHGRRGVSHLFMGSDAEMVIRTSPVPVLLVRSVH